MSPSVEQRINEVAEKLASQRVNRRMEKKSDKLYVRSTKAIDPDTHRSIGRALSPKR